MGRTSYRKIAEIPKNQKWLQKRFDVDVPARCSLHQCAKNAYDESFPPRRCIVCANYNNPVTGEICFPCLATEHLDNFKVQKTVENESWYQHMVKEASDARGNMR